MKFLIGLCSVAALARPVLADSYFYVGPEASASGETVIAHTVDPERMNAAYRTVLLPAEGEAFACVTTPMVSSLSSAFATPGAANAAGVAVTAGPSGRVLDAVLKLDSYVTGDGAVDVQTFVVQVARSARSAQAALEAVTRQIDAKGNACASTWLFADAREAWLLEAYTGHAWAAMRLPRDRVTAFGDRFMLRGVTADTRVSSGLSALVTQAGTRTADASGALDLFASLCGQPDDYGNLRTWRGRDQWAKAKPGKYRVEEIGETAYEPAGKLTLKRIFGLMRDRFDWTEYWPDLAGRRQDARCFSCGRMATAHVLAVRTDVPADRAVTMWIAQGPARHTPFLPTGPAVTRTGDEFSYDVTAKSYYYDSQSASHVFRRLAALAAKDHWKLSLDVSGSWKECETEWFDTWPAAQAKSAEAMTALAVGAQAKTLEMARWFTEDMLWHMVSQNRADGDFRDTGLGAPKRPRSTTSVPQAWGPRLEYKRREIAALNGRVDLVFLGDSITHFWEDRGKDQFAEITNEFSVLDLGYAGNNTETVIWRLKDAGELDGYTAKVVMVMIGTNNAVTDTPEEIAAGVRAVLDVIREKQPEAKILLLPIFPRGADKTDKYRVKNEIANRTLKTFADGKDIFWCDFNEKFLKEDGTLPKELFPDLLHPNDAGYRIWREAVMPYLRQLAEVGSRSCHQMVDEPKLTLGVVSDIHLNCPEAGFDDRAVDVVDFRKALHAFRAAGVDGVVIPGDLATGGRRQDLESVARIWYEVFPGDRLPDGRKVEKLFVTGNHDFTGPGESAGAWESCFHEPFEPVWMKTVKGYSFVGAHWICSKESKDGMCCNDKIEPFFAAHGTELEGSKPFFFVFHPHLKNTCFGPNAWGHEDGTVTRILSSYPNAVALTGHSHYSLTDDRAVWQGGFTALGCGSLGCCDEPVACLEANDENSSSSKGGNPKAKMLRPITHYRNVQGMVVKVYDGRLVVSPMRFDETVPLGNDWEISLPARGEGAFPLCASGRLPRFAAGAKVAVEAGDCVDRGGEPWHVVTAVFPQAMEGARALRYDVVLQDAAGRELKRKTVIEDGFNRARDPLRRNRCPFAVEDLSTSAVWRFAVYPLTTDGRRGAPIFSEFRE